MSDNTNDLESSPFFHSDNITMNGEVLRLFIQEMAVKTHISVPYNLSSWAPSTSERWTTLSSATQSEWMFTGKSYFAAAVLTALRNTHKDGYQISGYESTLISNAVAADPIPAFLFCMTGATAQPPFDDTKTLWAMMYHLAIPSGAAVNTWVATNLEGILPDILAVAHKLYIQRRIQNKGLPCTYVPFFSQYIAKTENITVAFKLMKERWDEAEDESRATGEIEGPRITRPLPRRGQAPK
ncbi:hypothetical protein B0H11DRAFT_2257756 [Mycena galericulata]|nr:hypothetical protein B0H11DRAFT_2257756 [Mycena galericulata]